MATNKLTAGHPLATTPTVWKRLQAGALQGLTGDANTTITSSRFASTAGGTQTFAKQALPATPTSLRITGTIKADKTSGRFSYVGFCVSATPTSTTVSAEIGHAAGTGIVIRSQGLGFIGPTLLAEASVVDGAEYRVCLVYENVLTKGTTNNGRIFGYLEMADGSSAPTANNASWSDNRLNPATQPPLSLVARTNSALGTIRDLTYVNSMFGAADDEGMFRTHPYLDAAGTDGATRCAIWSKGGSAPLRLVVAAGGSGTFGGSGNFGAVSGRNGAPYEAIRNTWIALADAGYTVVAPNALHEGWGANDHLTEQMTAVNAIKAAFDPTAKVFHLGYSMGGFSVWRSMKGYGGWPRPVAAYLLNGAVDLSVYYGNASYPALATRWPDPGALDSPINYTGSDLIATGVPVRSVISTTDTNITKASAHDVMKAKYAGNALFSEKVITGSHFGSEYWDPADVIAHFDAADTAHKVVKRASGGSWVESSQWRRTGGVWARRT